MQTTGHFVFKLFSLELARVLDLTFVRNFNCVLNPIDPQSFIFWHQYFVIRYCLHLYYSYFEIFHTN